MCVCVGVKDVINVIEGKLLLKFVFVCVVFGCVGDMVV